MLNRLSMKPNKAALLALMISLAGCVPPQVPSLTESGSQFGTSPDEKKLLVQAGRLHDELDRKGMLLERPELAGYIERVARPLVPRETSGVVAFRFHILRVPVVNAFAEPNGDVYLTVGLLSRMENEAELAQVLGHEMAHAIYRHSLKQYETRRSTIVAANVADLLLFGTSIAYLPAFASMASFSREDEEAADKFGLRSAVAAGYDPRAAVKIFAAMKEVKKGEEATGSAYGTHPTNLQRVQVLTELIQSGSVPVKGSGKVGDIEYAPFRRQLVMENIQLKLTARQYELTRDAADAALESQPDSERLHYYRGEAYRHMGDDPKGAAREHAWLYEKKNNEALVAEFYKRRNEFYADAEKAYEKALSLDHNFFLAARGLGLVHLRRGENDAAREWLGKYLANDKNAPDRQYVTNLLRGIEK